MTWYTIIQTVGMEASDKTLMMHNLASAAVNEGVYKGYFGIGRGQDYAIPADNESADYDFVVNGVPCNALVTRMNEFELAFQIYVEPISMKTVPHSGFLFTFWLMRWAGKVQINTPKIHPTSAATLECARRVCSSVIDPVGYSMLWIV